jgi:hypothetical protein
MGTTNITDQTYSITVERVQRESDQSLVRIGKCLI